MALSRPLHPKLTRSSARVPSKRNLFLVKPYPLDTEKRRMRKDVQVTPLAQDQVRGANPAVVDNDSNIVMPPFLAPSCVSVSRGPESRLGARDPLSCLIV